MIDPLASFGFSPEQRGLVSALQLRVRSALAHRELKKGAEYYSQQRNLARFLKARDFSVEEAEKMVVAWVDWYEAHRPDLITKAQVRSVYDEGKLRTLGKDREGHPLLWVRMRYCKPEAASFEEHVKGHLFVLEEAIAEAERTGHHQITVINDRFGEFEGEFELKQAINQLLPMLQNNYPERLFRFVTLGVSWFFKLAVRAASVFLSESTKEKVRMLDSVGELAQFISRDNLLAQYGGDLNILDCSRLVWFQETQMTEEDIAALEQEIKKSLQ